MKAAEWCCIKPKSILYRRRLVYFPAIFAVVGSVVEQQLRPQVVGSSDQLELNVIASVHNDYSFVIIHRQIFPIQFIYPRNAKEFLHYCFQCANFFFVIAVITSNQISSCTG